jgi:hypothetical protein
MYLSESQRDMNGSAPFIQVDESERRSTMKLSDGIIVESEFEFHHPKLPPTIYHQSTIVIKKIKAVSDVDKTIIGQCR